MYYSSVMEYLKCMKKEHKGRIAYRFWKDENIEDITYDEFMEKVETVAFTIYKKFGERNKIAIYGKIAYEWMVVYLGVLMSNNMAAPIDAKLLPEQKINVMNEIGITYVFCDAQRENEKELIYKGCKQIKGIFEMERFVAQETICKKEFYLEYDENNLAQLMFTSGSTGKNKIAMFTYKNIAKMISFESEEKRRKSFVVYKQGVLLYVVS